MLSTSRQDSLFAREPNESKLKFDRSTIQSYIPEDRVNGILFVYRRLDSSRLGNGNSVSDREFDTFPNNDKPFSFQSSQLLSSLTLLCSLFSLLCSLLCSLFSSLVRTLAKERGRRRWPGSFKNFRNEDKTRRLRPKFFFLFREATDSCGGWREFGFGAGAWRRREGLRSLRMCQSHHCY